MKNGIILFFILFNFKAIVYGQISHTELPPLDIPLKLSGNFGEFRRNHFHAGLDIKTKAQEGIPIKTIEKGSIRRIRISTRGYGKAIYIEHPNGLTSVYAHFSKFSPKIEALIKSYQYEKETFVIEKYFKKGELVVEKGELVGYSGNTGGSFGPHLHFEIRNTEKGTPLNPLQLNFDIIDTQPPVVEEMYLYSLDENATFDNNKKRKKIPLKRVDTTVLETPLLKLGGQFGIGVKMFDRQDLSYNKNGIYQIRVELNGVEKVNYLFDEMSFNDSKSILTLIDYPAYVNEGIRIQKLFKTKKHHFTFFPKEAPSGILSFTKGESYVFNVYLTDYHGNTTTIEGFVEGSTPKINSSSTHQQKGNDINPKFDYLFQFENQEVYFPKNSLFEPKKIIVEATPDTLKIGTTDIPQRKKIEVYFTPSKQLNSIEQRQQCLAIVKNDSLLQYVSSSRKENQLFTKSGSFGTYIITQDSTPPVIKPKNFQDNQWMSNYRFLKLTLSDNFSGIKKYRGEINGQWILLEHEPKTKTLTYNFDDIQFEDIELNLSVEVEDNCGNKARYSTSLYRNK